MAASSSKLYHRVAHKKGPLPWNMAIFSSKLYITLPGSEVSSGAGSGASSGVSLPGCFADVMLAFESACRRTLFKKRFSAFCTSEALSACTSEAISGVHKRVPCRLQSLIIFDLYLCRPICIARANWASLFKHSTNSFMSETCIQRRFAGAGLR